MVTVLTLSPPECGQTEGFAEGEWLGGLAFVLDDGQAPGDVKGASEGVQNAGTVSA